MSITPTTGKALDEILHNAAMASTQWASTPAAVRAKALITVADALDAHADSLVEIAQRETHLPEVRLRGELKRTTFQLRLFGEVITKGRCFDVRIDHADPQWPMGAPRPDLRRYLIPIGPVLVFSASNFPFAFSVAGGDSASALAAGNAVIVKAHHGHMELSLATNNVVVEALDSVDAPKGLFSTIFGTESGKIAIQDPRIQACGFTGGIPGGRALFDLAKSRPEPIPFYGELGSNNPVFVTQDAVKNAKEIVEGFIGSFTMGAGQFCTKPGTLVVPEDSNVIELLQAEAYPATHALLNTRIAESYEAVLAELKANQATGVVHEGGNANGIPQPTVMHTTAAAVLADRETLQQECFGPAAIVVTYRNAEELLKLARSFEGQLTATIFAEETEAKDPILRELVSICADMAGRVLWRQWPTGVSVTYAQQHGGPYPASTDVRTTSVGTAAIERFLRPVAYQGFPEEILPQELQDANPLNIPQQVHNSA
ncbi:aldehyde dehydrogenase (NADP(+)) [Corynebacterium freiburgense]|uniref:aldehyde dehydrogenase (NADP(+)) n=1 Tax=Corynebacterium freiburgense TaxID=556548 RepID=UPI000401C075|nr:aldehyde dehydrogenase (NADP(+)) [Corynebacterium freiburgense]WJZ02615.1 NADP-dependent fatty aldehyde dehydrogenase [Corynebacterium freiburgense]